MRLFEVEGHEPSFLPDGLNFRPVWSDEFDGCSLDESKWDYRLCMMGRRHPAWTDRGVALDGKGNAVFSILVEDGRPVSSQLQTARNFMDEPVSETALGSTNLHWNIGKLHEPKFIHRFGYYECRCRLQQLPGWWSAFWMQSPIIGASLDSAWTGVEHDIMESFRPGEVIEHAFHTAGYGPDWRHACCGAKKNLDKTVFHRFGLLWEPDRYTVYIDGEPDGSVAKDVSHCPEFILVSTEVDGYRRGDGTPSPEAFAAAEAGDAFLVDYVRVFDIV